MKEKTRKEVEEIARQMMLHVAREIDSREIETRLDNVEKVIDEIVVHGLKEFRKKASRARAQYVMGKANEVKAASNARKLSGGEEL